MLLFILHFFVIYANKFRSVFIAKHEYLPFILSKEVLYNLLAVSDEFHDIILVRKSVTFHVWTPENIILRKFPYLFFQFNLRTGMFPEVISAYKWQGHQQV